MRPMSGVKRSSGMPRRGARAERGTERSVVERGRFRYVVERSDFFMAGLALYTTIYSAFLEGYATRCSIPQYIVYKLKMRILYIDKHKM